MSIFSLRQALRQTRKDLSQDFVREASRIISDKIIATTAFQHSQHIAYYLPHENEVDLSRVATQALALQKQLYLPVFSAPHHLHFYRVDKHTTYQKNKFGILEPISDVLIEIDQLDLMLIPLVAFDDRGYRMGRGLGCYDRYLARAHDCLCFGVAYECQRVSSISAEVWDIPMTAIITERGQYTGQA